MRGRNFNDTSEYKLSIYPLREQTISDNNGTIHLWNKNEKEDTSKISGCNPADIFAELIFNETGMELLECINGKSEFYIIHIITSITAAVTQVLH